MTNRETVNEYKKVMGSVDLSSEAQAKIIEKSMNAFAAYKDNHRVAYTALAISGAVVVAAGIGAVSIVKKVIGN